MSEWESIAVGKMKEVRSRQGKVLTLAHKALSENRVNDIDSDGLALEAINKTKEEVDDLLTKKSLLAVEIYDGIDNVLKKVERYVAKMDEDVLKVYGKPPLPLPLSRGSGVSKGGKGGSSSNKNKKLNPGGLEKPLNSGEAEFIDPSEPVYCYCREVSHGEMLACDNDECEYEWFHYPCVRLTKAPEGEWLCPTCRGLDIPEPLPIKAMTIKAESNEPKENVKIEQMGIQKKRRRRGLSNEITGRTRKSSASVSMTSSTGQPLIPLLKPTFVNPPQPPAVSSASPERQGTAGSPPPVQTESKWAVSKDESKQKKEGRGPECPRKNSPPPEKPLPVAIAVTDTSLPLKTSFVLNITRRAEI